MRLRKLLLTALFAAVLSVCGPLAIPMGTVPVTLCSFAVYLAAGLLGPRYGTAAVGLYLALGALGLPVFAGFTGGIQRLLSPTGGYLLGYLLCALLTGWLTHRRQGWLVPMGLAVGTLVLYAAGGLWFLWQTGCGLRWAFLSCVLPFLPGDAVKIAAATAVIFSLRKKLASLEEQN